MEKSPIVKALELANTPYTQVEDPKFSKYESIYIAPTSNTKHMMRLYKNSKHVLSIGGTGALGQEAALNGATKVDLFDLNEFQRLFYHLIDLSI